LVSIYMPNLASIIKAPFCSMLKENDHKVLLEFVYYAALTFGQYSTILARVSSAFVSLSCQKI